MESEISKRQDIDFARLDYRALSGSQRARVLRLAIERAHVERGEALWRMMVALAAGLRRMVQAALERRARRRQRKLNAVALSALSDRTLKDIGIARSDIKRVAAIDWRRAA